MYSSVVKNLLFDIWLMKTRLVIAFIFTMARFRKSIPTIMLEKSRICIIHGKTKRGVFYMSPTRMSKIESATRIVLEFNEAFNHHDVAGMMQLMSDNCVFENTTPAPDGSVYTGKKAVTQFWQTFFNESPNALIEIEEVFGLGERCIMRWKYSWTDKAGKQGYVRGVDIFRVRDGFIHEKLSYVKG